MLAVPIALGARETQNDHVRTESADHPHHVAQDLLVSPFLEGFLGGLGEAEVDGAREKLLRAIDSAGCQQLLRSDHAQRIALFRADQILAALAARKREISGPDLPAAGEVGQQRGVFVVGVRGDHQGTADYIQLVQGELRLGRSRELTLRRE